MDSHLDNHIAGLLSAFLADLERPDFWWQIALLAVALALAAFVSRGVRAHVRHHDGDTEGQGAEARRRSLRRLAFPLSAALLVFVGRAVLRNWHPVNLLSIALPLLLSLAVIRIVFLVLRLSFRTARWLVGFERIFAFVVWGLVALHILGWLPLVIGVLEEVSFPVGKQQLNLWMLVQGGATVVVSLLLALWLGGLVEDRLSTTEGLDSNLRLVLTRLAKSLLVLLAVLISLPLVGIDLTTLSVFGGALGVGLGFGLQKIASNYVSGFIILLDQSIRLGNVISVGGDRGEVTRITTRYTVLRSNTGVEAIVPNEQLVSSVVLNESLTDHRIRLAVPVQVAYGTDLEQAMALLVGCTRGQARILADPAPQAFVVAFADSGINLELGFWIADPEAGSLALRSEINLAIWRAFRDAGIEIPYPRREVDVRWVGEMPKNP